MKKKAFMIGNAHLDPVWLWRWQEGLQEAKATFRSALDRMKEYDDFVFTSSSAALYEWVEHSDPEMFEEIRARVREGRWVLEGGWWIQPDCNIPCGEAFVRQSLYGQRYFYEKFGVTSHVGYNVDSFGHNNGLPQILRKSGMDSYVFMRPMPGEKGLPGRIFVWEGADGSRVTAFQIMFEYLSWPGELSLHVDRCLCETDRNVEETMIFYGVGNHGGGPTRQNIESIRKMRDERQDAYLTFGSPEDFFRTVREKGYALPVVHDDLQHHASGCYAAHSRFKKLNRYTENRLITAEKYAVMAQTLCGDSFPDLGMAWKSLLFNQFHDTMAGTCLEVSYDDAFHQLGESVSIADRAINKAIQAISWRIQIPQDEQMRPLVLFNPLAWPVSALIECEYPNLEDSCFITDEQGQPLPVQFIQILASAEGRRRIVFRAQLPSFGYRTYRLFSKGGKLPPSLSAGSPYLLENEFLRIEFDPQTGCIREMFDKENGVSAFSGAAAVPVVIDDTSDTWSHDVRVFNDRIDQLSLEGIRRIENGPVRSTIRVTCVYGHSRLVQDFSLSSGSRRVEVCVQADWHEKRKILKLFFPVHVYFPTNTYETAYAHIIREGNGEEEPCQSWFDISGTAPATGKRFGVSFLNDGKYSMSVKNSEVGLTVLRSPIYAHHVPYKPDPQKEYSYLDQGIQHFRYTILPHADGWREAATQRAACELNFPPELMVETYHPHGKLPQKLSFACCSAENVLIHVLKRSEDGSDLILRAWETAGESANALIELPLCHCRFRTQFAPCEIKTFRIAADGSARETDLIEGLTAQE